MAAAITPGSATLVGRPFPRHHLSNTLQDESKTPLVLVACGSFSPITHLHLRMFEMARDYANDSTQYEVIGGYFSPVSDSYRKKGLAPAEHRVRMCELALQGERSSWLMVDTWEPSQETFQRTSVVLDHFEEELNVLGGGFATRDGSKKSIKIMLLAGGDLIESFKVPDLWAPSDLHHILGQYGCLILERSGSDVHGFLLSDDILYQHRKNIFVIKQVINNDISSTKIRLFIKRNMSIKYLLPEAVINYIQDNGLYSKEYNAS